MPFASTRLTSKVLFFLAFAGPIPAAAPALANSGVYMPPPPSGPGGQDMIETTTGARCSQSVNGSGAYLDIGVSANNGMGDDRLFNSAQNNDVSALGYARVVIPLGGRVKRIDCLRLYEMELQRMRQEIELLRMGLE